MEIFADYLLQSRPPPLYLWSQASRTTTPSVLANQLVRAVIHSAIHKQLRRFAQTYPMSCPHDGSKMGSIWVTRIRSQRTFLGLGLGSSLGASVNAGVMRWKFPAKPAGSLSEKKFWCDRCLEIMVP